MGNTKRKSTIGTRSSKKTEKNIPEKQDDKNTSVQQTPVKRGRGRPRKSVIQNQTEQPDLVEEKPKKIDSTTNIDESIKKIKPIENVCEPIEPKDESKVNETAKQETKDESKANEIVESNTKPEIKEEKDEQRHIIKKEDVLEKQSESTESELKETTNKVVSNNEESESEGSSSDSDGSSDEDGVDICERQDLPEHLKERAKKLALLRQKMGAGVMENKKDVYKEFEKSKRNLKFEEKAAKRKKTAQELLFKQEVEESGENYERIRSWDYSIEDVERYNAKEDAKKENTVVGFADWNDVAQRKYNKLVNELKPDMESYNYQKNVTNMIKNLNPDVAPTEEDVSLLLESNISKPTEHAIEKLSKSIID
ncbi:hypothetical protein BB559_004437, partial [Furculomyces boomerangus]